MSAWIWILIPLVAIIGGYIIDYQKNKLKFQNATRYNEKELEGLNSELGKLNSSISKLTKRIENLEAIAAGSNTLELDSESHAIEYPQIEMNENQIVKENEKIVSNRVKSGGNPYA